jgi:hypothetical protein
MSDGDIGGVVTEYRKQRYNDIEVSWLPELDGGGRHFGQDFIPVVSRLFGKAGRVFEFCSGPGFIGFSLLAHGLCEHLTLADVNPRAVDAVMATIRSNGLEDVVTVHLSDGLDSVPIGAPWDLVVGNPPHFPFPVGHVVGDSEPVLLSEDLDWRLHERFFLQIRPYLAPDASILLQESGEGSSPATFRDQIEAGGLIPMPSFRYVSDPDVGDRADSPRSTYYLWARNGISGLNFDTPTRVDLAVPLTQTVTVPAGAPVALHLTNRSTESMVVQLCEADGKPIFWLPVSPLPPRSRRLLPDVVLPPGTYRLVDISGARAEQNRTLASIHAGLTPPFQHG